MSRIGRMPITVPAGVEVSIAAGNVVTVKGPKGTLVQTLHPEMILEQEGNIIHVKRPTDDKAHCALHGMTRALLHNMVVGVSEGFKKELEINGAHQVIVPEIDGITIEVPAQNKVVIHGADKQKVGQFAAEVREKRPPEPYKGKGIKYVDEVIRRKVGKTGAKK
ncbi:MAG: 50S ribosomal protein L6 [Firmicutes bacterium]|nr:50S ribosomal protein L6 [Bacillota bacterium]